MLAGRATDDSSDADLVLVLREIINPYVVDLNVECVFAHIWLARFGNPLDRDSLGRDSLD